VSPRKPKVKRRRSTRREGTKAARKKSARRPSRVPPHAGGPAGGKNQSIGELFEALVALQARLRAPGGCPWDREQTHKSLRPYLIEEAYEVLEAIDRGDSRELAEELGDLLLQVVFHAELAREAGLFDISTIISGIHEKMVRRHPHVFGEVRADTSAQVLKNWDQLKAKEKEAGKETEKLPSALDGVPRSLPALLEAYQLTRRAAKVGFDWENVEGILEKLGEEVSELRAGLIKGDRDVLEEEVGDLLFVVVNVARFLGFDPEAALKQSNRKFKSRFQAMEADASHAGQHLSQLSKEQLENLWEAAKAHFRAGSSQGSASCGP
jgi:tetrapyrrole methylase family protein/MazG family protein